MMMIYSTGYLDIMTYPKVLSRVLSEVDMRDDDDEWMLIVRADWWLG